MPRLIPDDLSVVPQVDPRLWAAIGAKTALVCRQAQSTAERRNALRAAGGPLEFVEHLIGAGVPADVGRRLTFDDREFWQDIYDSMGQPRFCVKSSAQVGKSIMLFYGLATLAHLYFYQGVGIWHGLYLPTREMVQVFSKGRLSPILRRVGQITGVRCGEVGSETDEGKRLAEMLPQGDEEETVKVRDSYNFKRIGRSYIYMAWMQGMLKDALPLDVVWFDEVRLMEPGQIDRVEKRVTGSKYGFIGYTSTAGMPGDAIDVRWEASDQRHFHHFCYCPDGVELNKEWPHCVFERKNPATPRDRWFLACPRCHKEIDDRGYGRWVVHKPNTGLYPGFNPHQLMTQQPLWRIMEQWNRPGRNTTDFFNQVLGLEHLDPESTPLTRPILWACVNEDLIWARPGDVRRTCMGIDQMGGNNYYVIAERTRDGTRRIVHVEIVWHADPFRRAAELMREYDVSVCCVEGLPNYNDAMRFANEFPGRVFIVSYKEIRDADLEWGDRQVDPEKRRKVSLDARTRFTVLIDYTKMLDGLATNWRERRVEVPHPAALRQDVYNDQGELVPCSIAQDVYFDHLRRIARRKTVERKIAEGLEVSEETGIEKHYWVKLAKAPGDSARAASILGASSDPHFAFADALCWAAWTRLTSSRGSAVGGAFGLDPWEME